MNEMIRMFDFATKSITTIPARELASGMVRAKIQGIDGEVWINASQANQQDFYRHPPFPEKTREIFQYLRETLIDAYPCTLEGWENGFRKDTNPIREIAFW